METHVGCPSGQLLIYMQIIKPSKLNIGDTIGVIAPSGVVEAKWLEAGVKILEKWGFKTKLGKHIFKKVGDYSAGTPQERREDFKNMIEDPQVKAITCAEGGYAANSILSGFSPEVIETIKNKPVIFFGYSDFCLFLNANFSFGVTGFHSPNLAGLSFHNKETQESLRKAIIGEAELSYGKDFFTNIIIQGKAEGYFLPTNLETLTRLFGSKFDPLENFDGQIILGLEEIYEDKSTLIRMMEQVISHKSFEKIKGIVLGKFLIEREVEYPKWGEKITLSDIFISLLKEKNIPIVEFPHFGHMEEQRKAFKILRKKAKPGKNIYGDDFFLSLPTGVKVVLNAFSENPLLTFRDQGVRI